MKFKVGDKVINNYSDEYRYKDAFKDNVGIILAEDDLGQYLVKFKREEDVLHEGMSGEFNKYCKGYKKVYWVFHSHHERDEKRADSVYNLKKVNEYKWEDL